MCMTFGCNPQINLCYYLRGLNFFWLKAIDTGYLVNANPPTFYRIFSIICRCLCQGLKTCGVILKNVWSLFTQFELFLD